MVLDFDELKPFLKIGGIVLGIALLGAIGWCTLGSGQSPCNGLPMDKINTCLAEVKKCAGSEDEVKACTEKAVRDSR